MACRNCHKQNSIFTIMPKYTFLLPAYKGRFLDEMLRSIQGQTYTDFKVIISDDCSPEDLKSICEPYLSDPRFTYRRNAENMGSKSLVSHWNLLVDMCDTEFLIMASDDDVYAPQFLEEIDKLTKKYPQVDLFRGRVRRIDTSGRCIDTEKTVEELFDNINFAYYWYNKDFITCISNYCYKTEMLKNKGYFVEFPLAWFSDDATNLMMANNGCATTTTTVFGCRQSDLNISGQWGNRKDSERKTAAAINFHHWMSSYMAGIPASEIKNCTGILWREKVTRNIQNNIYHTSHIQFLKYLIEVPRDLGLNKTRLFLHYLNQAF